MPQKWEPVCSPGSVNQLWYDEWGIHRRVEVRILCCPICKRDLIYGMTQSALKKIWEFPHLFCYICEKMLRCTRKRELGPCHMYIYLPEAVWSGLALPLACSWLLIIEATGFGLPKVKSCTNGSLICSELVKRGVIWSDCYRLCSILTDIPRSQIDEDMWNNKVLVVPDRKISLPSRF